VEFQPLRKILLIMVGTMCMSVHHFIFLYLLIVLSLIVFPDFKGTIQMHCSTDPTACVCVRVCGGGGEVIVC
jgi:hypothetical protein